MTIEYAIDIIRQTFLVSLTIITPLVIVAIGVGLVVSLLQSITSIQEQTLTFVPKLVAVSFAIMILANWMVIEVIDFTVENFQRIETLSPSKR